jgi:hypothetical protein
MDGAGVAGRSLRMLQKSRETSSLLRIVDFLLVLACFWPVFAFFLALWLQWLGCGELWC